MSMHEYKISPKACLIIDDVHIDIDITKENDAAFICHRKKYSQDINIDSDTQVIDDFNYY